jgi:hypothetical protein
MAGDYGHLSCELPRFANSQDLLVFSGSADHDRTVQDNEEWNIGMGGLVEYFATTHGT